MALRPIWLLLLQIGLSDFFSYAVAIDLSRSEGSGPGPTQAEIADVARAVGKVAVQSGLQLNPDVDRLRRSSQESKEYRHRIVADYISPRTVRDRVSVTVDVDKETGQIGILIRDLDSSTSTDFTMSLENEITNAIHLQFPSFLVMVRRETVGPELGP